ncbi:MAG: 2,3-bisphosphoglycerate-independent phosphoglycerate mutase [Patescibacteria group bacterium]
MAQKKAPVRRTKGPLTVLVWDGFGLTDDTLGNAIDQAKMPVWKKLCATYPLAKLQADGVSVGLPPGQPGNSEAGHATIGAGRPVESDQVVIDRDIQTHKFEDNPALLQAAAHCIRHKSTLHLIGLLTNGRSGHASPNHVKALIRYASGMRLPRVALHLFTDGRDTPPFHAAHLIAELEKQLPKNFTIATIMGRFYAMDRNKFWERTALAYDALTAGRGILAESPLQAVTQAYNRGESDEFITPTVICHNKTCIAPIADHDAVIFWNLRTDRARQLTKPFVMRDFELNEPHSFRRSVIRRDLVFVTLTEFGKDLDSVIAAYPHREVLGTIVEALRYNKQLYAAESEKFSQVTYFLNGGFDRPRFGEGRIRVPSPRVARYDHAPRMHSDELARRLVAALDGDYEFILANFANADMIGHTGNLQAGIKACEALDDALGVIWEKLQAKQGTLIVTADHGNVERMLSQHGGADTEHNMDPVPFLAAGRAVKGLKHRLSGTLADVAPTALWLLGVDRPHEMTGKSLLS